MHVGPGLNDQLVECHSTCLHQKVVGCIPGQGICLNCWTHPREEVCRRQLIYVLLWHWYFSLSLLPSFLSQNKLKLILKNAENGWQKTNHFLVFLRALQKSFSTTKVLGFFLSYSRPPYGSIQYKPRTFARRGWFNFAVHFSIPAGCWEEGM